MSLDSGATSLDDFTTFSDDSGVAEEAGASELEDLTSAELDTGAEFEDELSGESAELDSACSEELSGVDASAPESPPHATRAAAENAHKKTRA